MNDLTEQWNKGKLPEGDYYIKRRNGYLSYDNIDSHGVWRNSIDEDIIEVLAPVPSYDEWQETEQRSLLFSEFDNEIDELNDTIEEFEKENAQLKEQLSVAVEALKTIEKKSDKFDDSWGIQEQLDFIKAEAQSRLYQIEELEK